MSEAITKLSKFKLPELPPYLYPSGVMEEYEFGNNLTIVFRLRDKALSEIFCTSALIYAEENPAIKFHQLAKQVSEDCFFTQSQTRLIQHPAYQTILTLGKDIIPLLIKKLNENPVMWLPALRKIADVNPVPKKHRGNVRQMITDWKNWAVENGYTAK